MNIKLTKYRQASASEILLAEEQLHVKFPEDYKNFLLKYDGATVEESFLLDHKDICIRKFISVQQVAGKSSKIDGFPNDVWPIADDSNGNYVYIRKVDLSVYFWDHEVEGEDIFLAENFSDFINKLRPYNTSDSSLPSHRVVSSWVDPDFKPKFS